MPFFEKAQPARISVSGEESASLDFVDDGEKVPAPPEMIPLIQLIGESLNSYMAAAQTLLAGKYSHCAGMVPPYLVNYGKTIAVVCPDGLVVRYEAANASPKLLWGWSPAPLRELVRKLSQGIVYIRNEGDPPRPNDAGCSVSIYATPPDQKEEMPLVDIRVLVQVSINRRASLSEPPLKPYCALSMLDTFEAILPVRVIPPDGDKTRATPAVTRTKAKLPVGWNCLEIYPVLRLGDWNPQYAQAWAVNDILAAVVRAQMHEQQFTELDSRVVQRRNFSKVLAGFKALLDSQSTLENELQAYLEKYPALLCNPHTKVWPRLRLGDRITDFVFREPTGSHLLVEIERATHKLFRKDGHQSAKLTTAVQQILDWLTYIQNDLKSVRMKHELDGFEASPRGLVVIGRSSALTAANKEKIKTIQGSHPTIKIYTYDDVYTNAKAVAEGFLGPLEDMGPQTEVYYPPPMGP